MEGLLSGNLLSKASVFGLGDSALVLVAGNIIIANSIAEVGHTTYKSYVKVKQITLGANISGVVRVSFDIQSTTTSYIAYGRVYINDIAIGTERNTNNLNTYMTFTQDFTVKAGDKIQIYSKAGGGYRVNVKNLILKCAGVKYFTVDS